MVLGPEKAQKSWTARFFFHLIVPWLGFPGQIAKIFLGANTCDGVYIGSNSKLQFPPIYFFPWWELKSSCQLIFFLAGALSLFFKQNMVNRQMNITL
jgi:hypothetical protein